MNGALMYSTNMKLKFKLSMLCEEDRHEYPSFTLLSFRG
jgi:hypothetical protein